MKTLRFLLAGFIVTAFLCACNDEDKIEPEPEPEPTPSPEPTPDVNHPAPTVTLGDFGEDSLQLKWADVDDATSFTAQLLDMEEAVGYEGSTSETSYKFSGLEDGSLWYGRVRAEFEDGESSEWSYVTYSGSTEHAILVVGEGVVELHPTLELLRSTSSTLTFGWSFTGDIATDIDAGYEVALYTDPSCTEESLEVGWTFSEESGLLDSSAGCRFTFSGLEPLTTYYCKVTTSTYKGLETDVLSAITSASGPMVTATAAGSAVAGDVLVSEDFAKFYHGGDLSMFSEGYYIRNTNNLRDSNVKAEGMDDPRCTLTSWSGNEFDVFTGSGVTSGYTEGVGLSDWAHIGNNAGRPGYVKIGKSGENASIMTPELSALPEGGSTISVSFSAMDYCEKFDHSSKDLGLLIVSAIDNVEVDESCNATGGETRASVEVDASVAEYDFETFTVTLTGVSPTSRISIGTSQKRALLDDIVVTYLGVSNTDPLPTPENVAFDENASGISDLTLTWDAVENAYSYAVKYWLDGEEASAVEVENIVGNSYTIEDLYSGATYWAQVKACDPNPELSSDYSEAVSATTLENTGIQVYLVNTTCSTITIRWSMNGGTEQQTAYYPYDVGLYTSSDCVDETLYVSWIVDDPTYWTVSSTPRVRFTFSGLSPNTTYYAVVSRTDDDSLVSEPMMIRTDSFSYSVVSSNASAGDVILAESFSGLVHGGDVAFHAAGVHPSKTANRDEWRAPKGKNPTDLGLKVCNYDNEFNFFNGTDVSEEYTLATGFGDWCIGYEETSTGTAHYLSTNCSSRPGYAKVGGDGAYGYLATPELAAIPAGKKATVRVDFKALPYFGSTPNNVYLNNIMVSAIDNVELYVGRRVNGWGTKVDNATFVSRDWVQVVSHNTEEEYVDSPFDDYSVTLKDVTSSCRIRFSSDTANNDPADNLGRFLLNRVVITITALE